MYSIQQHQLENKITHSTDVCQFFASVSVEQAFETGLGTDTFTDSTSCSSGSITQGTGTAKQDHIVLQDNDQV